MGLPARRGCHILVASWVEHSPGSACVSPCAGGVALIGAPVQFFTTGFGDWRRVLPAGPVRDFYVRLYPAGQPWADLPASLLPACQAWIESDLARADGDRLTPTIPILTQRDRQVMEPWLDMLACVTVAAVQDELPALRQLAERYSNGWNTADHVLTILILWSVNMWVLRRLLAGPLGRHPAHGTTGRYFIWGEELGRGPTHITGIRANRGVDGSGLCLLVSRLVQRPGLKESRRLYAQVGDKSAVDLLVALVQREVDLAVLARRWSIDEALLGEWLAAQQRLRVVTSEPLPQVRVPVFGPDAMALITPICDGVAERITTWLLDDVTFATLLERCSFQHCASTAVLCMLWHNSYYEATDRLITLGILPPFPTVAEGEWGVWLTSHPYGQARSVAAHQR